MVFFTYGHCAVMFYKVNYLDLLEFLLDDNLDLLDLVDLEDLSESLEESRLVVAVEFLLLSELYPKQHLIFSFYKLTTVWLKFFRITRILRNIQNTVRWNYFTLANRRDSIYWLGFYVLIFFSQNFSIVQSEKSKLETYVICMYMTRSHFFYSFFHSPQWAQKGVGTGFI